MNVSTATNTRAAAASPPAVQQPKPIPEPLPITLANETISNTSPRLIDPSLALSKELVPATAVAYELAETQTTQPFRSTLGEILRTAWSINPTACVKRALGAVAETLADIVPPFAVTSGLFLMYPTSSVSGCLMLGAAGLTYLAGSWAKMKKESTSKALERSVALELSNKHEGLLGGFAGRRPDAKVSSHLVQHDAAKGAVASASNMLCDAAGQTTALLITAGAIALKSPVAAACVMLSGLYFGAVEIRNGLRAAHRAQKLQNKQSQLTSIENDMKEKVDDLSPYQMRQFKLEAQKLRAEITEQEQTAQQTLSNRRIYGLPLAAVGISAAFGWAVLQLQQNTLGMDVVAPISIALFRFNSVIQSFTASFGSTLAKLSEAGRFFSADRYLTERSGLANRPATAPTTETGLLSDLRTAQGCKEAADVELLQSATKPGTVFFLYGRNGSGKSPLAREVAESLATRLQDKTNGTTNKRPIYQYVQADVSHVPGHSVQDLMKHYDVTKKPHEVLRYLQEQLAIAQFSSENALQLPINGKQAGGIILSDRQLHLLHIGMALISDSKVVLFDEPQTSLNNNEKKSFIAAADKYAKISNKHILIATRDEELLPDGTRCAVCQSGKRPIISTIQRSEGGVSFIEPTKDTSI